MDLRIRDCCGGKDRHIFLRVEDVIMASASDQHCSLASQQCIVIRPIEKTDRRYPTVDGGGFRKLCGPIELIDPLPGTLIEIQHLNGNARRLHDGFDACLQPEVVYLNCIWLDVGSAVLLDGHALCVGEKVLRMTFDPSAGDQLDKVRLMQGIGGGHVQRSPENA